MFITEAAEKVSSDALKLLASAGFIQSHSAERSYRCSKIGQMAGIANEIAKVKIGDGVFGIRKY